MVFGRDVLLFEINVLFNQCIDSFKSSFEACFTNESSFDSYSAYDIIEALEKQLGEFSFFKIDGEIHSTTQLVISLANSEVTDDTLDILARYLNVGDTLFEDEITTQLLEQIKKLHLESTGISAYSAIVGPSFMGKTQIAFTLSQFISVIYVNLLSTIEQPAGCSNQKIYSLFAGIAGIFDITTCNDQANPNFLNSLRTATSISILKYPFQTLGLIYLLLRTRKLREEEFENDKYCENCKKGKNCEVCKEKIFPIKAWLIEVAKIKTAMVPAMTIDEFHAKTEDIDFTKIMVFIDELPRNQLNISSNIMFLRNLCRVVTIPTFVSGTDSKVMNMLGQMGSFAGSRSEINETKPWAIVNVKTSKASLRSFCHWVNFKDLNGKDLSLTTFVIKGDPYVLDYASILRNLYGEEATENQFKWFKKMADFFIVQAKTSLPGIISLVFKHLLELAPKFRTDPNPKGLWNALSKRISEAVALRKSTMTLSEGLLASAHILTFPSNEKKMIEDGTYSAKLVESHLFYYGTREDGTFHLMLRSEQTDSDHEVKTIFLKNNVIYDHKCYFPELKEDFFATFIAMNIWNFYVIEKENFIDGRKFTLATLYQNYLKSLHNYLARVSKTISDSFALELLSHWSICHASHQNMNGETDGLAIFKEFVKNVQNLNNLNGFKRKNVNLIGLDQLNEKILFLLERVQVPYLLRFPVNESSSESSRDLLRYYLGDVIEFGDSYLPPDKIGWDVKFDMKFDGISKTGLIECKLWSEAIGYAGFFNYYKKACICGIPLVFFVCRKIGMQISGTNAAGMLESALLNKRATLGETSTTPPLNPAFDEEEDTKEDEPLYAGDVEHEAVSEANLSVTNVTKGKRSVLDYVALLNELWSDPNNHIDIYTVKFDQSKIATNNLGRFTVAPLKTFEDSKGAFILLESNFDPPCFIENDYKYVQIL